MRGTLITIPFAGGNKYVYRPLFGKAGFSELVNVELPGRGSRIKEPLLTSFDDLVNDCIQQIKDKLNTPYVLFGHSLGALLAFHIAAGLYECSLPLPERLFLSGIGSPLKETEKLGDLPDDEFLRHLIKLGGIQEELKENDDFLSFMVPIVRADFQALESRQPLRNLKLPIPLTLLNGKDDTFTGTSIEQWSNFSTLPIESHLLPGGHFFLFEQGSVILPLVESALQKYCGTVY